MNIKSSLPFRPESTLRDELRDIYLSHALEWLTSAGDIDSKVLRAVAIDNPWETAYCIITILESREYLLKVSTYRPQYDQKVEHAVEYLVSKVKGGDQQISLDGNPYDTSLSVQAFLLFQATFPTSKVSDKLKANKILERALSWIVDFSAGWLINRTVGELDDVAQAILAVTLANQLFPDIPLLKLEKTHKIIEDVVSEIISLGQSDNQDSSSETYWDSVYVSAYVLIALLRFLEQYPTSKVNSEVVRTIRYGIAALEKRFSRVSDQPPDTALALQLYILVGSSEIIKHDLLPEIVFQTFRWLCDKKQRYQDGSIQRSVHYTVLFSNAIIVAMESIPLQYLLDQPINFLYDYIVSQIVLRETLDRSLLARLKIEIRKFEEDILLLRNEREQIKNRFYKLQVVNIWLAAFMIFVLAVLISNTVSIIPKSRLEISLPQVNDWNLLLVLITIVFPATYTLTRYIRRK